MASEPDSENPPQMQISMDLITSLVGSINKLERSVLDFRNENSKLQNAVTLLQNDNINLKGCMTQLQQDNGVLRKGLKAKAEDLITLQRNSGVLFPQFPKLPPELRRTIWQYACRAPQVHIIKETGGSRSKINSVFNACQEARAAAAALRLDSFFFSYEPHTTIVGKKVADTMKNYINLDVDTIWLTRGGEGLIFPPEDIQWECGLCHAAGLGVCEDRDHLAHGGPSIARFAIDYPTWCLEIKHNPDYIVGCLKNTGAAELLLVVGNLEAFDMDRDIMFVAPLEPPWTTRHTAGTDAIAELAMNNEIHTWDITWSGLANELVDFLQEYLDDVLDEIKRRRDEGDFDTESFGGGRFLWEGLEEWVVPKVRFVEAMKEPSQWVRRPITERW